MKKLIYIAVLFGLPVYLYYNPETTKYLYKNFSHSFQELAISAPKSVEIPCEHSYFESSGGLSSVITAALSEGRMKEILGASNPGIYSMTINAKLKLLDGTEVTRIVRGVLTMSEIGTNVLGLLGSAQITREQREKIGDFPEVICVYER